MSARIATREDLRRAAGRAVICGFQGASITAELRELLREVQPLGLILFARNIESPEQVAELNRELKDLRGSDPLLLCVDQEGGRVQRIRAPATVWPTMRRLGRCDDLQLVRRTAQAMMRELRAMHFDVDFAPVLDVDTNSHNPVIGDRAFARLPEDVARLGSAFAQAMQESGIAACGKHFPGHGDTDKDSHLELPTIDHDPDRLRAIEWLPFARAIRTGLGAIMTAHVMVPALDAQRPATLSRKVLGPLRSELGFGGIVISDDVEMKALAQHHEPEAIAAEGLVAGIDVFLVCHHPETVLATYRGIVHAMEERRIKDEDILASEQRILRWRDRYYQPAPGTDLAVVGCLEHQALAQEIRIRASENEQQQADTAQHGDANAT